MALSSFALSTPIRCRKRMRSCTVSVRRPFADIILIAKGRVEICLTYDFGTLEALFVEKLLQAFGQGNLVDGILTKKALYARRCEKLGKELLGDSLVHNFPSISFCNEGSILRIPTFIKHAILALRTTSPRPK